MKTKRTYIIPLLVIVLTGILFGMARASDTMLMFVGEDLEVLSIASRREEAAWSAPAIAGVVTRREMEEKGAATLAQALEDTPGFYMDRTERGVVPYLRGIQNSALFMFDTVPMNSGIRKSDVSIGYETSLAAVKRLEIVRGAGSVLWGPDAFAGMVNIVPLTGRDFQGVETGFLADSEDIPGEAYVNWGTKREGWNSFLSVSGRMARDTDDPFNVVRFWGGRRNPAWAEPIETRYGRGEPDDSRYINVYGNMSLGKSLTLSARINDIQKADTVKDRDNVYSWQEMEEGQSGVFKVEASTSPGLNTGLRFTGFYARSALDRSIVDYTYDQKESTLYGELILDQSMFRSKGLATLGASFRQNNYDNVPVWNGFLPDYYGVQFPIALPEIEERSFSNNLSSVFGQYRYDLSPVEFWVGARYDHHDQYESAVSYNAGAAWNFGNFIVKGLYGTAFRTPYFAQLQEADSQGLEKIKNTSLQVAWKDRGTRVSMTLFRNAISDHVIEDRYEGVGLPAPNEQTIYGAEFEIFHQLLDRLSVSGNLTLMDNSGPNQFYNYYELTLADEWVNTPVSYAYETGPSTLGSVRAVWEITDHIRLIPELRYVSGQSFHYLDFDEDYTQVQSIRVLERTCNDAWVTDLNLLVTHYFPFDLSFYINNLFDDRYLSPGVYSMTRAQGLSFGVTARMRW